MQDFVLSSIYESYDFESIPEIPFEWLLLFCIYPEVNWKIARQLKDQHKPRIPTDFSHNLFDQAENSSRLQFQIL